MENKKISKEQGELLREPLDPKAISQHPTKKFLSTIKAIYVVERLNQVFGTGEWKTKTEVVQIVEKQDKPTMVVVKSTLTVNEMNVEVEAFGGNDNADLGDAYKGAATDALTKIGSYLGIGIDVFKGLSDVAPSVPPKATVAPLSVPEPKDDKQVIIKKIITLCDNLDTTLAENKKYPEFIQEKCGCKFSPSNFDHIIKTLKELN